MFERLVFMIFIMSVPHLITSLLFQVNDPNPQCACENKKKRLVGTTDSDAYCDS